MVPFRLYRPKSPKSEKINRGDPIDFFGQSGDLGGAVVQPPPLVSATVLGHIKMTLPPLESHNFPLVVESKFGLIKMPFLASFLAVSKCHYLLLKVTIFLLWWSKIWSN